MSTSPFFSSEQMSAMSGGPVPPAPKNYKLPDKFPSLSKAWRICLDLESHDPDLKARGPGWRRDAYPVGAALAIQDRDGTISFSEYYPLRHKQGPNVAVDKFYEYLSDQLAFYTGAIVGANLLYDADGLQYQGVYAPCAKWLDVQWAEALLDENAMSYKLDTLAMKWLGEHKVTDQLKELYGDYITRFREVHPGHARAYGLGDVTLPLRILDAQYKGNAEHQGLNKQHLTDLFHLESRQVPFLLYMRKQGVRVDLGAASKLGDMLIARRDESLRKASALSGVHLDSENFGKPTVVAAALDRLGIKYPMTAGREASDGVKYLAPRPSIKDAWLEMMAGEFGEELAVANQCDKAFGTFVDGYVTKYAINDRVHAEFHPLRKVDDESGKKNGTVTGRYSAVHPNLQNIPARDEEIGPLCRALFIADEGADWWSQDYCVAPDTRVLTANLEWKRADDLSLGEELIGCDETPKRNKTQGHRWLRRTKVERLSKLRQSCLRITTDQGTVTCSTKHRWLARRGQQTYSWRRAEKLKPGQIIAFICKPWEEETSKDSGYLTGLFDGEGTLGFGSLSFAQKPTGDNALVLEKGIRLLKERGYNLHVGDTKHKPTAEVHVQGGREEIFRLLGSIRPVRLLAKSANVWEGRMLRSKTTPAAKIISIEYLGEQDVLAIQTTEKTFIAEGLVSHNSQIEYRFLVHYAVALLCKGANVPQEMYKKNPDTDFHELCAALVWALEWNEAHRAYKAGEITEKEFKKRLKELRKPAKNLNFGLVYGMGLDKLAATLGMIGPDGKPTQQAKDLIDKYHAGAPFIRDLANKCSKEASDKGYITTILNRRRRFELWEPKHTEKGAPREMALPLAAAEAKWGKGKIKVSMTHKAGNARLQGSAADLMKKAMVDLWESGVFDPGNDITCVLTVHDELNGSVIPSARGKAALAEVKRIMETCMTLNVPILTSGSTGRNWSEAK